MDYSAIIEGELENKIAVDFFGNFDCTKKLGNIDFSVVVNLKNKKVEMNNEIKSLLWAEVKRGNFDFKKAFVQLTLTIGKERTFDRYLPPNYIGAIDANKIVFFPYHEIQEIFYLNDFNWKITPSDHKSLEFNMLYEKIKDNLDKNSFTFYFESDEKELKDFIKKNLSISNNIKVSIDKNNFINVYNKWLIYVKPTISINWDKAKNSGIIDGDFYLADLLSNENQTIKEKLYVLLKKDRYELSKKIDDVGLFTSSTAQFKNNDQNAHTQFWNRYERPPKEEYWDYIVKRRDLLVPQDIRERKGSYFTPQIWVEQSQNYIADYLGSSWQEEFYVWDCAAGTGNLLNGLTNKYNVWASTLDKQDVDVISDRIKNGANLLENHVFQFDFLNDDFSKIPASLLEIINDIEKRKKLIIYINPPYAEVSSNGEKSKAGVNKSKSHDKFHLFLGTAAREIYILFLTRIYKEIDGCIIGEFSTLKTLQGSAFEKFRFLFKAKLEKCFLAPSYTFDNVKGKFPIGFKIWNTNIKQKFNSITADVFDEENNFLFKKTINVINKKNYINNWIAKSDKNSEKRIGFLAGTNGNDFQNNNIVYLLNEKNQMKNPRGVWINLKNLKMVCVYFAVRKCIETTWLNNRDQFLVPDASWQDDIYFQSDCLIFTLFHNANNISSKFGKNSWIPYTELEVSSKEKFEDNFMSDYIKGKCTKLISNELLNEINTFKPLVFSNYSASVLDCGREIWKHYFLQHDSNPNASFYDIKEYFNKKDDKIFIDLFKRLKFEFKILNNNIKPKVYEHKFLVK